MAKPKRTDVFGRLAKNGRSTPEPTEKEELEESLEESQESAEEVQQESEQPAEEATPDHLRIDPLGAGGKYPQKKGKPQSEKKKKGNGGLIGIGKSLLRSAELPKEDTGTKPVKVKKYTAKTFLESLYTDDLYTGGDPLYAGLTANGLYALYFKADDEVDRETMSRVDAEMQLRGISKESIEPSLVKVSYEVRVSAGKKVTAACNRRAQMLEQMSQLKEDISEGIRAVGQQDSQMLKGVEKNLESLAGERDMEQKVQEQSKPQEQLKVQERSKAQERASNEGLTVVEEQVASEEQKTSQEEVESKLSSSIKEMQKHQETQKSLKEVLDAIQTLDDYHDFVEVVRGITDWDSAKGVALYQLMVPVEFRVWGTINQKPPIINYLETAVSRKDDKSHCEEVFDNVTCIFHELVLNWCAKEGLFENEEAKAFILKRHEIYKDYNGHISEIIKEGKNQEGKA